MRPGSRGSCARGIPWFPSKSKDLTPIVAANRSASPSEEKDAPSLAVALRREPEQDARARVIAKGEGAFAEQILEVAFDRGVKVRSDADLAEILSAVEVDCEIPLEALAAVAEILSYVYQATNPAGSPPEQSGQGPEEAPA